MEAVFIVLGVLALAGVAAAVYTFVTISREQREHRELLESLPKVMIVPAPYGRWNIEANRVYTMMGGWAALSTQTFGNYATKEEAEKDLEHMNLIEYREKQ
jgi:Tfp pilus assembly protein PilV